ncbi:hypothetical protein pEaSNUABM8_00207 [Erwinia phage pEa_SNUABM_8]|nr:hypothetical protein pEaSNUABM8_00207 [Erwinia phage pEa_SNUABM_8]QVW54959.1 hypothetical protein pEaSNUABM4_00206 [Erwinia phage pEa_SNUABM_4]
MLQIHKYFDTVELERLHREGELPKGDILGTARLYMAKEQGSVLILLRDAGSWDVNAVFVDIPDANDRLNRNIYCLYSDVDTIDNELFQSYLRDGRFRFAEVHLPSNTRLDNDFSIWRIMRHKKQAIGQLTRFSFMNADTIEKDIKVIAEHGETARLEIHLSMAVRKADADICKRLTKYGFTTRKYIYHVIP